MNEPTMPDARGAARILLAALVAILLGAGAIALAVSLASDVFT